MDVNVNIGDPVLRAKLDQILVALNSLGVKLMATLADLQAAVAADTSAENSAITLITGLAAQIQTLINASSGSVSAADLQPVVDSINANATALAAAVTANTPAPAPVTPPAA